MSDRVTCLWDWKKWGAFVGVDYRLQLGRYARCPYLYDKVTQQMTLKPEVEYGVVAWIGEEGVQAKLVLNQEELKEAGQVHVEASHLALYASRIDQQNGWKGHVPQRYEHPLKPGVFLWSVTEVNKYALAKEGLLGWYHKKGVEGVLELVKAHHFEHAYTPEDYAESVTVEHVLKVLEEKKLRPTDLRDKAGEQGRTYHKLAMFFLQGKNIDLTQAPKWQTDFVSKFAMWCTRVALEPLAVEQTVYEEEPNPMAGTLDALASVKREWVEQEWERLHQKQEAKA